MITPQAMAWADALKSGQYPQHRGRRAMAYRGKYSAYGVLCALHPGYFGYYGTHPHPQVMVWLGCPMATRVYIDAPDQISTRSGYVLARVEMRDLSVQLPFFQIGDLIEHFGLRTT